MNEGESTWRDAHAAAIHAEQESYLDPLTGYLVFTELYHRNRRKCCGSGCRHCPYRHAGVPSELRDELPVPFVLEASDGAG